MYVYFERQLLQQIENQVLLFKSFHSIPQRILFNCGITHFFQYRLCMLRFDGFHGVFVNEVPMILLIMMNMILIVICI